MKQVKHSNFHIGKEFFTATGRWRCTDIGTRVIVAISLEAREMVRVRRGDGDERTEERFSSDDLRDLNGPPYMIAEQVFDEYDIEGCYPSADQVPR